VDNVLICHTAELDDAALAAARALCESVFTKYADTDWENALGGVHALIWEDGRLVAHAALVARRLLHGGRPLRTGYVESVAVAPDRRRLGYGAAVMQALHPYLDRGYALGALGATDAGAALYARLGWSLWAGRTAVLAPDGIRMTPNDDRGIFVRPVTVDLDPAELLICDWRDGDLW
jgi:aminoglycoside 2'-N-acetyltransferase I